MAQITASSDNAAPQRANKPPRDAIDEEALRTGRPVGRFVDGAYRYSLPVILGVTSGTEPAIVPRLPRRDHEPDQDGQVLSVFSSSLSTAADFAALRRLLMEMAGASAGGDTGPRAVDPG